MQQVDLFDSNSTSNSELDLMENPSKFNCSYFIDEIFYIIGGSISVTASSTYLYMRTIEKQSPDSDITSLFFSIMGLGMGLIFTPLIYRCVKKSKNST